MWGASLFSSIQSPKSLLASKLAASLASHFEVDPSAIESSLVNDAKIVLQNIILKPQCVGGALLVGRVETIEFSWKWGGSADGSTSFVRETVLSIRGARFRLIAKAAFPVDTGVPKDSSQGNQNSAAPSGFMDKYVEQIIDHLTLNITDVEFAVEMLDEAEGKLIVEAKSVQLLSLGRLTEAKSSPAGVEPAPPLSQRLSVGSLRAYILDSEKEFLLLDPFAYATLVRRVSGRRFQGLAYGLDVTGDIGDDKEHENRLVIHAGSTQVAVLSKIFGDLLDDSIFATEAPVVQQVQLVQQPEVVPDPKSTVFQLPFPSLVLWLPNGSKIQMPRCEFQYYMDGSGFRLTGADGIRINDNQAPFLKLAKDAAWSMDFVTSTFSVGSSAEIAKDELCADHMQQQKSESLAEKVVAHVEWDEEPMKLVIKGLFDLEESSSAVVAKGMDACSASDSSNSSSSPWSFTVQGNVSVLMNGRTDEWIKGCVRSMAFALSSDPSSGCILSEFEIAGAQLGPTSFGDATIHVPATILNSETNLLSVKAPVQVHFDSVSSIEKIQGFMSRVLDIDFGSSVDPASRESVTLLPVSAYIPSVQFAIAEPMQMTVKVENIQINRSCTVDIESLRCESNDGIGGSVLGLSITNCQDLEMRINRIEFLHLPGMMDLGDPVESAKLRLNNGTLEIELESIHVVLAEPRETSSGDGMSTVNSPPAPMLPCPVSFHANEISLTMPGPDKGSSSASIKLRSIGVALEPANDGSFTVTSQMSTSIRVLGNDEYWLEAQLDPALLVLSADYVIRQAKCSGIRISTASVGHVAVTVPSFEMLSEKSGLRFDDAIDISLVSYEALLPIQGLVNCVIEASQRYSSGSLPALAATTHDPLCLPFSVFASKIRMIMIEPSAELNLFEVQTTAGRSKVNCAHLTLSGADGMSASVAGIEATATLEPDLKATFESIETLHIPGVCSLRERVRDSSFSFSSDRGLGVEIGSVSMILLNQTPASHTSSTTTATTVLPFPVQLFLEELTYDTSPGANDSTLVRRLQLSAEPDSASNFASIQCCLNVSCLENKMIKAHQVSVSGVYGGTGNTITDLKVKLDSATVSAGFSSVEWKQVLKPKTDDKQKVIWMLPSAHVAAFSTNVSYSGKVMSTTTVLRLREFIGGATTTLDEIMKHFTSGALRQIPSFFSNAAVLGESVVDIGAKNVGRMVLSQSLVGSVTGSVGGLVVSDGIRGAIASGKKARGAPDDGKYHFGDFTKGSIRALQETSKKGGSMRAVDSQSYQVGDFSRGASTSTGKYAVDNKERLGAAGGSSIGMMVGAVALGPIGLIAGGIIGAKAASKAFSDKKEEPSTDEGSPPQSANIKDGRDSDLLGLGGASMSEHAVPVPHAGSTIDPFAPAAQPLTPLQAMGDSIASISQPPLHPLQAGDRVADPFATVPETAVSQYGIGGTEDPLTHQQQQSVSHRPNMHRAADPFADVSLMSTPREVDVSDDDPFGLTAQASRAAAGSHSINANHSPMSQVQPRSNAEQGPPFSAPNNYGNQNTGGFAGHPNESGMHVGPRQKAPPTPTYSNHQDLLETNSPYAPPNNMNPSRQPVTAQMATGGEWGHSQHQPLPPQSQHHQQRRAASAQPQVQKKEETGYRFGDFTRSIVAEGKKNSGRSKKDGYKFGDFTRGFLGS
jgi:hypothetical protein